MKIKIPLDVKKTKLDPDDILVFTTEKKITMAEQAAINKCAKKMFSGHQFIILEDGLKLNIVKKITGDGLIKTIKGKG